MTNNPCAKIPLTQYKLVAKNIISEAFDINREDIYVSRLCYIIMYDFDKLKSIANVLGSSIHIHNFDTLGNKKLYKIRFPIIKVFDIKE